jgi:hypothetical protein
VVEPWRTDGRFHGALAPDVRSSEVLPDEYLRNPLDPVPTAVELLNTLFSEAGWDVPWEKATLGRRGGFEMLLAEAMIGTVRQTQQHNAKILGHLTRQIPSERHASIYLHLRKQEDKGSPRQPKIAAAAALPS